MRAIDPAARQLLFGGIADDLTGGLELAAMLVRAGVPARVLTSRGRAEDIGPAAAAVIALKIRVAPRRAAVAAALQALAVLTPRRPRMVFQKYCATFDSTRRGNIGPIADALAERLGAGFTAFCPAFPEVARTVYQGHLFVAEELVSRSPKRLDPLTPMREPDLTRVLAAQTKRRVGLIRHADLAAGDGAVAARIAALRAREVAYAIADAVDEADLMALAAASVDWPLMTGGSSVAAHYPAVWRERGWLAETPAPAPLAAVDGPGVVIAGSCAERTREQLDLFGRARPVLALGIDELVDARAAADRALAWAQPLLSSGPVAIASSAAPEDVAAAQRRFGAKPAAAAVEAGLGAIAVALAGQGVRRFVVAGGETSGAVLDALGVIALDVGPYEAPGLSRAVSTGGRPSAFHLKSGKLGAADMFMTALA